MKKAKRPCALLCAAALLCGTLTACGKPGGQAPLTGTYDGKTVALTLDCVTDVPFSGDMASVTFHSGHAVYYAAKDDRFNLIDTDGKPVFAQGYLSLSDVTDGTVIAETSGGVYQKIDLGGSVVAASSAEEMNAQPPAVYAESSRIRSIEDGQGGSDWWITTEDGTPTKKLEGLDVGTFENGLAPLFRGDKLGLIAEDGTIVIEPTWTVYRNDVQRVHLSEGRIVIGWGETENGSKLAILKVTAS